MIPNLTLIVVSSALIATGVYLFLSRSLVRALMGFLLMGNGINLLFIIGSGPPGSPPIVGAGEQMADPVPQALVLTAIVITLAMTAFVLALAHRSWQLGRQDLVDDDTESARIHARAEADDIGDDRSAREQAAEIAAESERSESRRHEDEDDAGQGESRPDQTGQLTPPTHVEDLDSTHFSGRPVDDHAAHPRDRNAFPEGERTGGTSADGSDERRGPR